MDDGAVLQVHGLVFSYPGWKVFDNLTLAAPAGPVLVQGDESSGKTTLLRLLAGELVAQAGTMRLHGAALHAAPPSAALPAATPAEAPDIFWADARSPALDEAVARDWLALQERRHARWDTAACDAHVQGFALQPHLDKPFFVLSAGSRRKVLMAAALASGAALTLIDEPVAGLDKPSMAYLSQALAQAAAQPGARVLLVAHYEALPGVPWRHVVRLP